jgi:methylated-DNA-[protein]-cysteine S-methyltransferase
MKKFNSLPMGNLKVAYFESPIGVLKISATDEQIVSVLFFDSTPEKVREETPLLNSCVQQLDEYFSHKRQQFDLSLLLNGTPFQKRVWDKLLGIPYGRTSSYLEIAIRIGNPKAIRAVGSANGKNPIAIIIPCHRVIGANGKLIGYGGGLWRKEWLLKHEQSVMV